MVVSRKQFRTSLLIVLAFAPFLLARAQSCGPGETLWKNDTPAGPPRPVPGVCEDDSIGSVFTLPASPVPQSITAVSVLYANSNGTSSGIAEIDLRIFDGVSWTGNTPELGPKVFDYRVAAGGGLTLTSSGFTTVSLNGLGITVGHATDDFVVVADMLVNTAPLGSCVVGYSTNFATDNASFFSCTAPHKKNLLHSLSLGGSFTWVDPSVATVLGIPLCPLYYNGNWGLRACSVDGAGAWTVLGGAKPGSAGTPELRASGTLAAGAKNALYLGRALGSASATLVFGVAPLNAPFKGGVMVPAPLLLVTLASDVDGVLDLPFVLPALPPATPLFFQYWITDPGATHGVSASNALQGLTP